MKVLSGLFRPLSITSGSVFWEQVSATRPVWAGFFVWRDCVLLRRTLNCLWRGSLKNLSDISRKYGIVKLRPCRRGDRMRYVRIGLAPDRLGLRQRNAASGAVLGSCGVLPAAFTLLSDDATRHCYQHAGAGLNQPDIVYHKIPVKRQVGRRQQRPLALHSRHVNAGDVHTCPLKFVSVAWVTGCYSLRWARHSKHRPR